MISLRPYQADMMERVRAEYRGGARTVLMVAPTGSGKTVCFSWLAHSAMAKGNRVLILAHRSELLDQIADTLAKFDVPHGFIAAGRTPSGAPVQVASVQTLANRLAFTAAPDLIVIDEAHHAIAGSAWGKVLAAWPRARLLGVTATPQRLSGEGLKDTFETMVIGPTTADLIEAGALSRFRIFAPPVADLTRVRIVAGDYDKRQLDDVMGGAKIVGDAVEHYGKHAAGKRAVVFCVSLRHAEAVTARFAAAGYRAAQIDGKMAKDDRKRLVRDFSAGRVDVLTSCDVVSEGFDLPAIEVAILMRPTQSLALYLQQVGRALRPWPGKEHALILDHAGNAHAHGFPDDAREWTLDGRKRRKRDPSEESITVKVCGECFAANPGDAETCFFCGAPFPLKVRRFDEAEGELAELQRQQAAVVERREEGRAQTLADLIAIGKQRGYKQPVYWAHRVLAGRAAKRA